MMVDEDYRHFTCLYRGRDDVIGEQQPDGSFSDRPEGLTAERFRAHLRGEATYAIYNKLEGGTVAFAYFDLDVADKSIPWQTMCRNLEAERTQALRLQALLLSLGLAPENLLVEFPTVGYHLLLFFDRPAPAERVKALMATLLRTSGLPARPYYPYATEAPRGDMIRLPLRTNLNTGRRSIFLADLATFDPARYEETPNLHLLRRVRPLDPTPLFTALGV